MSEARSVPTTTASYHVASARLPGDLSRVRAILDLDNPLASDRLSGARRRAGHGATLEAVVTTKPSANAAHPRPAARGDRARAVRVVHRERHHVSATPRRTRASRSPRPPARAEARSAARALAPSDAPSAPSARRRRPRHRESAQSGASVLRATFVVLELVRAASSGGSRGARIAISPRRVVKLRYRLARARAKRGAERGARLTRRTRATPCCRLARVFRVGEGESTGNRARLGVTPIEATSSLVVSSTDRAFWALAAVEVENGRPSRRRSRGVASRARARDRLRRGRSDADDHGPPALADGAAAFQAAASSRVRAAPARISF